MVTAMIKLQLSDKFWPFNALIQCAVLPVVFNYCAVLSSPITLSMHVKRARWGDTSLSMLFADWRYMTTLYLHSSDKSMRLNNIGMANKK
jgi:hypothetical protein